MIRKKIALILILVITVAVFVTPLVRGQTVSVPDLLNSPDLFNKRIVEVEGEAIGEPLLEGQEGVWVNILSEGINLGIFVANPDLVKRINHWGSFRTQGDTIRVQGTFYKECSVHQGVDLHAHSIEVIQKGHLRKQAIPHEKVKWTIITALICLITVITYLIKGKYGAKA